MDLEAKKRQLREELKRLRGLRKEKLLDRGDAFRIGDGWHDNATFDSLTMQVDVLNSQIRRMKEELAGLKGG